MLLREALKSRPAVLSPTYEWSVKMISAVVVLWIGQMSRILACTIKISLMLAVLRCNTVSRDAP